MSRKDASNRSSAETIIPRSVPVKNKGIDQDRHRLGIILLIGAVILVVAAGAGLLHFLSKNSLQPPVAKDQASAERPEPAPSAAAPAPAPPVPAVDPEQTARDKETAEQRLAEFLATKNGLDDKGAAEWGVNLYAEMIDIGRQADSLLIQKAYQPAAAEYARATAVGRQLADRSDQALQRILEEGRVALTEGDGAVARRQFNVALMIDPANPSAQKGLKRAQTIETVLQLIESGRQHEKNDALALARTEYEKALQIDPAADEARQALSRVTDRIKEAQFGQLMSQGLTALHRNDYALARTRLLKAKSLKPDSREATDALLQVDQALRLGRIDRLRDSAQKAEQSEDWQNARQSYLAVLDIDPNLQFAVRGQARAAEQIRIAKRLDFYLTRPRVLESDTQLENAVLLLQEAKATAPRGQKLAGRINALEGLIAAAQTPVRITIESDNLTQVAVYQVGQLGRFAQRELELRPGTYTVVGARDGYRDVRLKIVVKPDQQNLRVTVQCKDKI
jgi:hypothetical protein